ncbi:two-component system regulatory protein YycI [Paenalkalicoccus suaedae]|uniref:Two-component system regulatory protein YycI n=1 Tax=Paenalkalicoccus suaedae TaxID=2592382 RepID=A0A859FJW7_9BACI|nr:two-component system regulatory protein YycI [Paenalkalicoccus suaedae]QKS73089.1 two-component system regulatory protein YycI [Paenalkalicoccus suaedae]
MDWSKTKSIFIVTFFMLNIFLGYQLYEKQAQRQISDLPSWELESQIAEQNIDIQIEDPEETLYGAPITAQIRTFQEPFLNQELEDQTITLLNDSIITSELDTPVRLVSSNLRASVEAFLSQNYVLNGDRYEFAAHDEDEGVIGLYQTYDGIKIDQYDRENFHLLLFLNEEGNIDSYQQTYLAITEQGAEQELLSPVKVIEVLMRESQLPPNSVVDGAELGYYNRVEIDADFQVYAPVWRIQANDEYYFVDAIRGELQSSN